MRCSFTGHVVLQKERGIIYTPSPPPQSNLLIVDPFTIRIH